MKNILNGVVFVTGASVLIIEIVATRILSIYFGNTIYSVTSVISVILLSLSIGYYIGGILADKKPYIKLFYGIILLSGFLGILLLFFVTFVLSLVANIFSVTYGPLIVSLFIFTPISIVLGMLSPFAIRLQKEVEREKEIGTLAGRVYFFSTLGSIFGSLFAGFYLVPHFKISTILAGISCVLIFTGLSGLIFFSNNKKRLVFLSLFFVFASYILSRQPEQTYNNEVMSTNGIYSRLTIFDTTLEGRNVRYFFQDKNPSSAEYLDSNDMVFRYAKYWELYKLYNSDIKNALILGAGIYSVPRRIMEKEPHAYIDVVDIEPGLDVLAEKYFGFIKNEKIASHTKDGRRFLIDTDKKYDYIFSDAFSSYYSIPAHMSTVEFFELVKKHMTDDGVFIANIVGDLSTEKQNILFPLVKTIDSVFPQTYYFAVTSPEQTQAQNFIVLALKKSNENILEKNLEQYDSEILLNLKDQIIDFERYDLTQYPYLTDDYAPVDYLTVGFFQRR